MLEAIRRRGFSLDPLMAEAKRRARQRRMLIALALLLLAGLAAGLTFALRSPGGGSPSGGGLTSASYSHWGVSLRYPAGWTRLDCDWSPQLLTPISLLTTAQPPPTCAKTFEFPPPLRLGPDGAVVYLGRGSSPYWNFDGWKMSIDGQPALIRPRTFGTAMYMGAHDLTRIPCPAGVRREYRAAYVKKPGTAHTFFGVAALVCGPHIATGDAAVRRLIASLRLAPPTG